MTVKAADNLIIPAIIPNSPNDDLRETLLIGARPENERGIGSGAGDVSASDETEYSSEDEQAAPQKRTWKRWFLAVTAFLFGCVALIGLLCWFFGFGLFAPPKTLAVGGKRELSAAKGSNGEAPANQDDKLRMALDLIAAKSVDSANTTSSGADRTGSKSDDKATADTTPVDLPPVTKATEPNNSKSGIEKRVERDAPDNQSLPPKKFTEAPESVNSDTDQSGKTLAGIGQKSPNNTIANEFRENGRSSFFGIEKKAVLSAAPNVVSSGKPLIKTVSPLREYGNISQNPGPVFPLGTLLPVRLVGAVYTLRLSDGPVRMELLRRVAGKQYSFPAGTQLIGRIRGSEYNRAFITVEGLIDPETGDFLKVKGEAVGNDGASGITGRRRKIKSAWSRVLSGIKETGITALNALGTLRSGGGSVVIADSVTRGTSRLRDELAGAMKAGGITSEFVEITAGTTAFVLVTEMPNEKEQSNDLSARHVLATGLNDQELAELLTTGTKEEIRSKLGLMTPAFRELAERVLASPDE